MKIKKSTAVPIILLIYLAAMAYVGLPHLYSGRYMYYFGIIATTLVIIILLHFTLKRREKNKEQKEEDKYTTYADADKTNEKSKNNGKMQE